MTRRARRTTACSLLTLAALVLLAAPASAENPVLDAEGDADVTAALTEAQEVQGVCYGYALTVSDGDTGQFSGTFASSSVGEGRRVAPSAGCPEGVVELQARITYTSAFSEAEDSSAWTLVSTLGSGLTIQDVERVSGSNAGQLLNDDQSETALLNAVLALPGLATEEAGVPPLVLDPNTEPLPADARATGTPGSDWLRENGYLLAFCGLLVAGGVGAFVASRRAGPGARPAGHPHSRGPQPGSPQPGSPRAGSPRLLGPPRTTTGTTTGRTTGLSGTPWDPPADPPPPARGNPA